MSSVGSTTDTVARRTFRRAFGIPEVLFGLVGTPRILSEKGFTIKRKPVKIAVREIQGNFPPGASRQIAAGRKENAMATRLSYGADVTDTATNLLTLLSLPRSQRWVKWLRIQANPNNPNYVAVGGSNVEVATDATDGIGDHLSAEASVTDPNMDLETVYVVAGAATGNRIFVTLARA